mmetsp:Transcript_2292/g.5082  ORF Transcript_2292/g.5082 Transcript_2292/m.5082 type:complete len:509 (+) Transcript_2292:1078-2604(+)
MRLRRRAFCGFGVFVSVLGVFVFGVFAFGVVVCGVFAFGVFVSVLGVFVFVFGDFVFGVVVCGVFAFGVFASGGGRSVFGGACSDLHVVRLLVVPRPGDPPAIATRLCARSSATIRLRRLRGGEVSCGGADGDDCFGGSDWMFCCRGGCRWAFSSSRSRGFGVFVFRVGAFVSAVLEPARRDDRSATAELLWAASAASIRLGRRLRGDRCGRDDLGGSASRCGWFCCVGGCGGGSSRRGVPSRSPSAPGPAPGDGQGSVPIGIARGGSLRGGACQTDLRGGCFVFGCCRAGGASARSSLSPPAPVGSGPRSVASRVGAFASPWFRVGVFFRATRGSPGTGDEGFLCRFCGLGSSLVPLREYRDARPEEGIATGLTLLWAAISASILLFCFCFVLSPAPLLLLLLLSTAAIATAATPPLLLLLLMLFFLWLLKSSLSLLSPSSLVVSSSESEKDKQPLSSRCVFSPITLSLPLSLLSSPTPGQYPPPLGTLELFVPMVTRFAIPRLFLP